MMSDQNSRIQNVGQIRCCVKEEYTHIKHPIYTSLHVKCIVIHCNILLTLVTKTRQFFILSTQDTRNVLQEEMYRYIHLSKWK